MEADSVKRETTKKTTKKKSETKGIGNGVNKSAIYLGFWVQREQPLSAFISVDLIQLVCLPGILRKQKPRKKTESIKISRLFTRCSLVCFKQSIRAV